MLNILVQTVCYIPTRNGITVGILGKLLAPTNLRIPKKFKKASVENLSHAKEFRSLDETDCREYVDSLLKLIEENKGTGIKL